MSIDAILFDLDDTLYPYPPCNEAGKAAALACARDRGYDLDRDAFDELYQRGRREVKREIPETAASHDRVLYCKRGLELETGTATPADASAIGEAFWQGYIDEMALYPTVEETLETLCERGIKTAIVTDLTARVQLAKLDRLGIGPSIDVVVTSEEAGGEKPSSAPFTLALSRLDRRPSEAVMVGDNVDADIVGANAVGLETVLFDPDDSAPASLTADRRPDYRIRAIDELLSVID